jgi:hypothetical protein
MTIFATPGPAAVPGLINYQGQLNNAAGTPVADGTYEMRFYLYDAEIDGHQVWNPTLGEEQRVVVIKGIYNVQLGAREPLSSGIFDQKEVWLEMAIYNTGSSTWETLTPRQKVTSVAYALRAGDADTLGGNPPGAFSLATHEHNAAYVNEGQANSVTGAMITDSSIGVTDLADNVITGNKILDNSIAAADLAAGSVGSSEVSDESLTAADLGTGSVGSNEVIDQSLTADDLAPNSVGTSEVINESLTASDLAPRSVGASEIQWSLFHTATSVNGGILGLTNSSDASNGNYPMGISGAVSGSPLTFNPVIGVFGGAPGLGSGSPIGSFPKVKIGVGGASDTGYGVAGVSNSGYGVYGYSATNNGGQFYTNGSWTSGVTGVSENTGNSTNYGGYFSAAGVTGRGVYATATGENAHAIYGYSPNGVGIYTRTNASDEHAAYFSSDVAQGLAGAVVYARTNNPSNGGIALWAHNDNASS